MSEAEVACEVGTYKPMSFGPLDPNDGVVTKKPRVLFFFSATLPDDAANLAARMVTWTHLDKGKEEAESGVRRSRGDGPSIHRNHTKASFANDGTM